jgi:hypothetical protein
MPRCERVKSDSVLCHPNGPPKVPDRPNPSPVPVAPFTGAVEVDRTVKSHSAVGYS